VRAALACLALAILVVAIALHGIGNEPAAEAAANWTFAFMLAAALLPQRADDWGRRLFETAIRRVRSRS
jgi:hypothetical protein